MERNDQSTNPMYQQEYDEQYEYHESHIDITETTLTFFDWFEHQKSIYADDTFRLHLLQECYHKILSYSIYCTSTGIELTDSQTIMHCSKVFEQFLSIYR